MQIILHLTKNLSQPQDKGREKQNFKNIKKTNKITYKNRRESSLNYFSQETKGEFHLQKRKRKKEKGMGEKNSTNQK